MFKLRKYARRKFKVKILHKSRTEKNAYEKILDSD